jgi:hypothetical protein
MAQALLEVPEFQVSTCDAKVGLLALTLLSVSSAEDSKELAAQRLLASQ